MPRPPTDLSDFELLRQSASEAQAFAIFYGRYERLVAGWLMRQTRNAQLAADLTAEVFAAAYLGAPRFREGPAPASAWLLGIARRKLLRSLRKRRVETSACRRLGVERVALSDTEQDALVGLAETPALALLDELPSDQRDAVRGRVLEDLDYGELAARDGVSEVAVRKRVSRGLATLRRRLQSEGDAR